MLNLDEHTGLALGVDYPDVTISDWYRDAKLGVSTHRGILSLPAWAESHDGQVPVEDVYARHRYAGWYGNTVCTPASSCRARHVARLGEGTSYEDLADRWRPGDLDANATIRAMLCSGVRYVVPMTKHHDGLCLWDIATTSPNATRQGPGRGLTWQLVNATWAAGAWFGVYLSGVPDWYVPDLPSIQSDRDLSLLRCNDGGFARYAVGQLTELIDYFRPSVLWNDIEWSGDGRGDDGFRVVALWRYYPEMVPGGVINDRWGMPTHGFLTRRYSDVGGAQEQAREVTRGLGLSFSYNAEEDEAHSLDTIGLIYYFVDVATKNGNLLTNVGPCADGSIPQLQQRTPGGLGAWLEVNGTAILGSRPWRRAADGEVRYIVVDGVAHAFLLSPVSGELRLSTELAQAESVAWLGVGVAPVAGGVAPVPESLRAQPVVVATIPIQ